jgi:hypothetical protein
MQHRSLRRIALGLAVAALVPATAQARPLDLDGTDLRVIHTQAVAGPAVVGAEDLAFARRSAAAPAVQEGNDGYEVGTGSVAGLVLILAGAGAALAVRHSRKANLSPA